MYLLPMVSVRPNFNQPAQPGDSAGQWGGSGSTDGPDRGPDRGRGGRFNVLLTQDREQHIEHWTSQLPRLMRPLGVEAFVATTGRQALALAEEHQIHAALIDLHTPRGDQAGHAGTTGSGGGIWLLEVLARRPQRPPVVVVNTRTYTPAAAQRYLNTALRLGAFSVIDQPIELDQLLRVIQRLIDRNYRGQWPTPPN